MTSSDPTHLEQLRLAETRRRELLSAARGDAGVELLITALFLAAATALWFVRAPGPIAWSHVVPCVLVTALAMRIRFQTPFGFTVATQLAFVPLAFALAPALLPLAVLVAFLLAYVPDAVRARVQWSQLIHAAGNVSFSLGPAFVFAFLGPARHAGVVVLLLAFAAQLAADFAVSTLCVWITRGASLRSQLAEVWWVWAIDAALSAVALVVAEQSVTRPIAVVAVVPLLALLGMFARERSGRLDKLLELNATYRGTALLLGDVVEADDAYTGMHSQGVVALALAVGDALGLDAERRRDLEFAALLHDVGKITIPKEIINKPGSLDPDEWEIVKTHAVEGQRMLSRVGGFMADVGTIVRSHHERWDGAGYPDGLIADGSPLEARIITACDSWSAMRTDRPYRRAMSHESAVEELRRNTGTQFDPHVARALLAVVGEHEPARTASPTRLAASDA